MIKNKKDNMNKTEDMDVGGQGRKEILKKKPWKNNAKHRNRQAQKMALQGSPFGVCPQKKK